MNRHSHAVPYDRDPDEYRREPALPDGFFRKLRFQTAGRGELRLAAAVLEDAVHCLERDQGAREFLRRLFHWEAEQWFASKDREPLFSFENICAILNLDADEIRKQIRRWREGRRHGFALVSPDKAVHKEPLQAVSAMRP